MKLHTHFAKVHSHFAKSPLGVTGLEIESLLLTPATIIIPPSDDEIIVWSLAYMQSL